MKKLTSALLALSFVAAGAASAGAQTSTTPGTSDRPATERRSGEGAAKRDRQVWNNPQLHEARDIIGMSVEAADGKKVGKVEDLLMEPREGKVTHAVIGMGGVMGLGEDKVVVPYSALKMGAHESGRKAAIKVDQATLESAPKYAKASDRERGAASPATTPSSGTTSTGSSTPSDRPASEKK